MTKPAWAAFVVLSFYVCLMWRLIAQDSIAHSGNLIKFEAAMSKSEAITLRLDRGESMDLIRLQMSGSYGEIQMSGGALSGRSDLTFHR